MLRDWIWLEKQTWNNQKNKISFLDNIIHIYKFSASDLLELIGVCWWELLWPQVYCGTDVVGAAL